MELNRNKNLGFSEQELFRRLEEKGCPVCSVLEHHDRKYFSWFSFEKYHEPAFIESITHALGFCARHGAYLDQQNHWATQITAVHKHVASFVRTRMAAGLDEGKKDLHLTFKDRASCPVCSSYEETSERTLWFFKKIIGEKEGLKKYGSQGILCFLHLQGLIESDSLKLLSGLHSSHESAMLSAIQVLKTMGSKGTHIATESGPIQNALSLSVGREQNPGNSFFLSRISEISENWDPPADFISSLKENSGCPICKYNYNSLRHWIYWLNKNLNSTDNYEGMRDVLPTCNAHVWSCIRLGNPELQFVVASAALLAAQEKVSNASRHLKQMNTTRKQSITFSLSCPVCSRIDAANNRALNLLFALLQESRYRIDFENGYALCLKHLADALDMQPSKEIGRFLIRVESTKLALLEWELEETMRKTVWAARPETKGSEQSAWQRALVRFSGLPMF